MFENCKKLMDGCQEKGVPALDLVVYHQGKEVFREIRGARDAEGKSPLRGDEKYNIYSCSKVVTVAAARAISLDSEKNEQSMKCVLRLSVICFL